MYIFELVEVIKMQMKPISEQRIYDSSLYYKLCIWFGSVGRVSYKLDGPGSNPGGDEIFRLSRPALGPTQPPVTGSLYLFIWLQVICVYYVTCVPTTAAQVITPFHATYRRCGCDVFCFCACSAQSAWAVWYKVFHYLIGSFQSIKLNVSPNGIHGQNVILAVLLYRHVANEAGIW